jgi:phosphoserine phosphatase
MDDYSTIYAYGDSKGDREMLALAQHPHFKPFNL